MKRRARFLAPLMLTAALVAGVGCPASAADNHTGSSQPYLGYVVFGPFVLKKPGRGLTVEVALAFTPEFELIVSSLDFGRQKKVELSLRMYEAALYEFLDSSDQPGRDRMRDVLLDTVNAFFNGDATREVRFTKFHRR